jgi:hypothetical protein
MTKKSKVTKRKMSSMADRVGLTFEKFLDFFLARESRHTRFTHKATDDSKEKARRRMRKAVWAKQRGYR